MSLLFASFIKNSIDRTKQGMNNEPLSRDKVQKFLKFLNQINLDTLLCNAKLDFWFFGADITKFIMIYRLHNQAPATEQNKNVFKKYIKDLALKYVVISLQNHFCQKAVDSPDDIGLFLLCGGFTIASMSKYASHNDPHQKYLRERAELEGAQRNQIHKID